MPTYNTQESHLREAVQSILNQTFADFEFLILDDGSASAAKIREIVLSFTDPRIKFFENETNLGISPSRNKLLQLAQGEYIAVQDHDDISLPERLRKEVDFLDKNPEVGVVGGAICKIARGKTIHYPAENQPIEEFMLFDCVMPHQAAMIRKKILDDNGIFYEEDYSPSEDYAMWCRLIGKTRFANLKDVLLHYRVHPGNTSHEQYKKMGETTLRIKAFARSGHPLLWYSAQSRAALKKRYRLFGVLPLMTVITQDRKTNYLLFGFLRILKCNTKEDLSGGSM
jgi:glycosyltransferase involved in cell wall biosynthesis